MATVSHTAVFHPAARPPSFAAASPVSQLRLRWMGRAVAVTVSGGGDVKKRAGANSNYVVPMDDRSFSLIARPLEEILRDLHRRIPDNIVGASSPHIPWYQANRMLSFNAPGWCGEIRDVIFAENGSVTVVYRVTIRGTDGELLFVGAIFDAFPITNLELASSLREIACGSSPVSHELWMSSASGSRLRYRMSSAPKVHIQSVVAPKAHRESTGTVSANDAKNLEDPVAAAEEIAFCRACARFGLGLYLYHEK